MNRKLAVVIVGAAGASIVATSPTPAAFADDSGCGTPSKAAITSPPNFPTSSTVAVPTPTSSTSVVKPQSTTNPSFPTPSKIAMPTTSGPVKPPPNTISPPFVQQSATLPRTGGSGAVPLLGLAGLLLVGIGVAVRVLARR